MKKAGVLMLVAMLVFTFSLSAFAEEATVNFDDSEWKLVVRTPTDPVPNETAEENGEGQGPHNPIYVAGD